MEKIGTQLKERRIELGYSIEEMSEKTRLTIKHIRAIEDGDIKYFNDDLSYLRYYLKSYCDALGVPFHQIKEQLNFSIQDYTMTFDKSMILQHEQMEQNIKENSSRLQNKTKIKRVKKRKFNIDISLLSLLSIIVSIIIGLIFAFVVWFQDNKEEEVSLVYNKPPVATVPEVEESQNNNETSIKEPVTNSSNVDENKEEEVKEMTVEKISDTNFIVKNLKKDTELDIEILFGSNSSFRALVDGNVLSDPAPKTYYPYKTLLHVKEKAANGKKIQLAFGFMQNNQIKLNGKELQFDEKIINKQGSVVVEILVEGE